MNNREYFNSVAEKWDSTVNHDKDKIERILRMADLREGNYVLDVGTGTGVMIPYLISRIGEKGRVIAVDIAEKMIDEARKKYSFRNVEFHAEDVLKVQLPKESIDCIMCYSMFPHFEDQKTAVGVLARHLKPGGRFVICHSQSRDAINRMHAVISETVKNDKLPAAKIIKEYYESAAMETILAVDNDELFVIIGRRIL